MSRKDNFSNGKVVLKTLAICSQNIYIAFLPENKMSLLEKAFIIAEFGITRILPGPS